jgi:hypothetical protein
MYFTAATRERVKEYGSMKVNGIYLYLSPHKFKTCFFFTMKEELYYMIAGISTRYKHFRLQNSTHAVNNTTQNLTC